MKSLISTALCIFALSWTLNATGYRVAVVPVEFSDVTFEDKAANLDNKINRAQIYFNDQFYPHRNFSFELLPVVRLPKNQAWYGANSTTRKDEHIDQAVREACSILDRNLSVYDNDGDGTIDNLCIITAGGSEAGGDGVNCIWPQQGFLHDRGGTITVSGKTVDGFTVCPERSGLGIFCHEFAHSLGLQDLYDTDGNGSGGTSKGVWGSLSLMDGGANNNGGSTPPNFCAIELEQLGLGTAVAAGEDGSVVLHPVGSSKEYLRLESDVAGEYFLLECRDRSGWDEYAGGEGLLIYHVDRSANNSWYSDFYKCNLSAAERWEHNQVNCRPDHQCARVVEAVPNASELSSVFFPQPGRQSFGSDTDPAFKFWSGATSGLAVTDIEKGSGGSISFRIITPLIINDVSVFQDAAIISWNVDGRLKVKDCSATLNGNVSAASGIGLVYSATLEGLSPATDYRAVIRVNCEDGAVYSETVSFTTKSARKGVRPFIYLNVPGRLADGSFLADTGLPLRVYNAYEAQKVEWFFNDESISAAGFWYLRTNGTLKAKVWYQDGSYDVIVKQLKVAYE